MTHEIIPFLGLRQPVSSGTHILALFLSFVAVCLLWRRTRDNFRVQLIAMCFGLSMVMQYSASAAFHGLERPWNELRYYLLLDVSAIFVIIAGTYTPPLMLLLRGWRRPVYVACMWLLAGVGISIKWLTFTGYFAQEPTVANVFVYSAMALFSPAILLDVVRTVGYRGLQWALYAACAYGFGLMVEARHTPVLWPGVFGSHELFHTCAVAGSFFHFIFICNYVLPYGLRQSEMSPSETEDQVELAVLQA